MKDSRLVEMRVFLAVLDTGGFAAAAAHIDVSQAFVSQTVMRLEKRVGLRLLHRSTRTLKLTDEGRLFAQRSRAVFTLLDEMDGEFHRPAATVSGHLSVSAPLAFGMDQVTPLIADFACRHPDLRITLSLSDTYANLLEDDVDVAVRMGKLPASSLIARRLCGLRRIVVASPEYLATHGTPRSPSDLAGFQCLLWDGARDHLNRWSFVTPDGGLETFHASGRLRSSNGLTLVQLCQDGMGIMRMAEHLACPAIAQGRLVPLLETFAAADDTAIHAVHLPERRLVPRIRAFVEHLIDAFRDPPWMRSGGSSRSR